ncbi:MAG: group III truncated hemoglobin [Flavobacteriaceae bacterium]|jgi:hemoglobin|nr:group III truncated hemoglobin [Flavobacteriaceae bacterium]
MKPLETRTDIEFLVNRFYHKVRADEKIGIFFTEIVKVNWEFHLPKMYNFWETLLFGKAVYKGNPMAVHFPINAKKAMEKEHFNRWLELWTKTVEENFTGKMAKSAVSKAKNIADLMAFKMEIARR